MKLFQIYVRKKEGAYEKDVGYHNNNIHDSGENIKARVGKLPRNAISGDAVTVETSTGNLFEFYGSEDWSIGDCVSMIIDSCGTQKVTDDMVIDAHYSAWKLN